MTRGVWMGALVAAFAAFAATAQGTIVISAGDCARVVAHVPDADLGTGRPMTPAGARAAGAARATPRRHGDDRGLR